MNLFVKKLNLDSILPSFGSNFAAGLDVYAYGHHMVPAHSRLVIPTGISIEWHGEDYDQYYMRIAPRSGLSVKHQIDIGAGVIDYDYRGQINVCFINNGDSDYNIKSGDRIAQLILERINRFCKIIEIEEHSSSIRGSNGFGSTGI